MALALPQVFRKRLQYAREGCCGMTQAALAKKCKLHPAAISHFETGQRMPSIHISDLVARARKHVMRGELTPRDAFYSIVLTLRIAADSRLAKCIRQEVMAS